MSETVVFGGVDLCDAYKCFIEYGTVKVDPPEAKTYTVTIPGGDDIDLTDAITGHAAFNNRTVEFGLYYDGRGGLAWSEWLKEVSNALDGTRSDFTLSWDEGYTYSGRASVSGVEYLPPNGCRLTVTIDANPWKVKQTRTTTVSALNGVWVTCQSGRRPVHPLITAQSPVTVNWQGSQFVVPAGNTYRLADVTFSEGENKLYLSIYSTRAATWGDVASYTWQQLGGMTWGNIEVPDPSGGSTFTGNPNVTITWQEAYL